MKAITINDDEKFLRQVSKEVDIKNDKELINDIKVLEEYCKNNSVMAMAAVQLGIPKRLIYLKNTNIDIINKMQNNTSTDEDNSYNEGRVLINPVILKREGLTDYWEACASCLDNFGHVRRPYKITLEYEDMNAQKHEVIFKGFESTVLSHEFDHLNGILHMDIADKVMVLPKEERKVFRRTHGYNVISKTGNYEKLLLNNTKYDLIRDISKYKPFNKQEEIDKKVILDFINSFEDIITRKNLFGHITASALVVNETFTHTLLVNHNIFGGYIYPGGHADGIYDLQKVAIREVKEETGIDAIPFSKDIFAIQSLPIKGHTRKGKYVNSHIHYDILYLLIAKNEDMNKIRILEEENSSVKWVKIDDNFSYELVDWVKTIFEKLKEKMVNIKKNEER